MSATVALEATGGTGPASAHRLGAASAMLIVVLAVLYLPTLGLGFVAVGGTDRPLADPFLAVAEVLILLMGVPLIVLFAAVTVLAPPARRIWGVASLGFVLLTVGATTCVHVVELTVARSTRQAPWTELLFGWRWPGVLYGIDVAAWDVFFGVGTLCAAAALSGRGTAAVRVLLVASGSLDLIGLIGPTTGEIGLRAIGIAGYAVVFPVASALLARALAAHR